MRIDVKGFLGICKKHVSLSDKIVEEAKKLMKKCDVKAVDALHLASAIGNADALIEKLGYANAARFIAFLGGHGDMTKEIRARREKESLEEIVSRIRKRKSGIL